MKRFRNNLGWYFNETGAGFEIKRIDPSKKSLRNYIIKSIIFLIIVGILVFIGLFSKAQISPGIAIGTTAVTLLIIIFFVFTGKVWLQSIIRIQHGTSSLIINNVIINNLRKDPRIPCYLFNAEIEHDSESGLYKLYLRPSEFLKLEEPSEDWNPLVWETREEKEADEILEELRQSGVGETDPEKQCPVVPGNKKLGIAILVCWILCLLAIVFYINKSNKSELYNPDSAEPIIILLKNVLVFGLSSFIIYAGYQVWFGFMVIKNRQIPPPKAVFFSEMRLFHGKIAVKRGKRIIAIGCIAIAVSLILAILLNYKLKEMTPPQNNHQSSTTNQIQ